ncbi:AraC family transcriptional regulator [Thalassotalea atypica]|uniref:AraC family transcriptional regulator n=1 Tax=Thalassotalea atypica TaxID=2054316 RepID=UPI0025748AE7|nr:AraC family transcriptional regulator [Thalassotalea atypica]
MNDRTITIHYINALLSGLKQHGKNADLLLTKFGITQDMLSDSSTRVSFAVYAAINRYVWKVLKDENMGFGYKPLPNGAFYYAGSLAIGSENLEGALKLLVGFYNYVEHGFTLNLTIGDDESEIEIKLIDPSLDSHHMLADFLMVSFHRFCCWLIGQQLELQQVEFDFPTPVHKVEYARLFSCPKKFSANKLAIRFTSDYLSHSIVRNTLEFNDYVAVTPMNILLNPVAEDNYTTKVKQLIEGHLDSDFPNFEDVATQLSMVPKTLRQKLKLEGCTYQQIKDDIRRDLAIYCLYQPNYTIANIAEKVGFTETGAFIRAFKGWTNYTPGNYRAQFISTS